MSGRGSGCLFEPLTGISPPSSWCSRSGSWKRTPEGLTLRVIKNEWYSLGTFGRFCLFVCFLMGQNLEAW